MYYGVIGDQVCIYVINIHPFSISYCHLSKIASNTQEVAIKKMRSNKSKEFLAELKVLCKIHHINVVRNDALVFFFFFLFVMQERLHCLCFRSRDCRWSCWVTPAETTTSTWFTSIYTTALSANIFMIHYSKVFNSSNFAIFSKTQSRGKLFCLLP